jgi:hypothetical protein
MAFVDVDQNSSTFDSSSATLSLPSGASVLFAGLYWSGRNPQNASLRTQVNLSTPTSGSYLTLNGSLLGTSTISDGSDYQSFVNVTSQVAAAGSGTYTAANVQASTGTNTYAGSSATETRLGFAIDFLPEARGKAAPHVTPLVVPFAGEQRWGISPSLVPVSNMPHTSPFCRQAASQ